MDKSYYYDLSLDSLSKINHEYPEYKDWSKTKKSKDSIMKYLKLIQINYNDAILLKKLGYNKNDNQYGPRLYYTINNNDVSIYINRPVYSYNDMYTFDNDKVPVYNLLGIINYIENKFNFRIKYSCVTSPINKDKFLLRIEHNNDEENPIYIRDTENNNEFDRNKLGYKKAALAFYLFYIKKYIYTMNIK